MIKHTALFAALMFSVSASGGREDDVSRFLIGPDDRWHALPTEEEMAEASRGVADPSAFAEYAQRRLELASLVTEVVFVDDDAPVGGDGTSWQTAHQSLQDALARALTDPATRTADLGGALGTRAFADTLCTLISEPT